MFWTCRLLAICHRLLVRWQQQQQQQQKKQQMHLHLISSPSVARMSIKRTSQSTKFPYLFVPRSVLFLPRSSTPFCLAKPKPQSIIQRHRLRYATLAKQLASGLHALQIKAKTPTEIEREALRFSRKFAVLCAHSRPCFLREIVFPLTYPLKPPSSSVGL